MKFEIIGDLSKLEILTALKYIALNNNKIKIIKIDKISKLNDKIYLEVELMNLNKKGLTIPQSFIRYCKIQVVLSNKFDLDKEIKITTELIKKKLNNY